MQATDLLTEFIKLFVAFSLGVIGKSWNDRRKAKRIREDAVRSLVACVYPTVRSLTHLIVQSSKIGPSISNLSGFLGMEPHVISPDDLEELSRKVRSHLPLSQEALKKWRQAEVAVSKAQEFFESLRTQSVFYGEKTALIDSVSDLKEKLVQARKSLWEALEEIRPYTAPDTAAMIHSLRSEAN